MATDIPTGRLQNEYYRRRFIVREQVLAVIVIVILASGVVGLQWAGLHRTYREKGERILESLVNSALMPDLMRAVPGLVAAGKLPDVTQRGIDGVLRAVSMQHDFVAIGLYLENVGLVAYAPGRIGDDRPSALPERIAAILAQKLKEGAVEHDIGPVQVDHFKRRVQVRPLSIGDTVRGFFFVDSPWHPPLAAAVMDFLPFMWGFALTLVLAGFWAVRTRLAVDGAFRELTRRMQRYWRAEDTYIDNDQREFAQLGAVEAEVAQILSSREEIFNRAPVPIFILDAQGHIFDLNPMAAEWVHTTREEAIGRPVQDFLTTRDMNLTDGTHNPARQEVNIRHTVTGQDRIALCLASGLGLPGGQQGSILSLVDKTEKYGLQQQLRQADRMWNVGELAAMTAHELRNPLTSIRATAQLGAMLIKEPNDRCKELFTRIVSSVDRVNDFIQELLTLSKPTTTEVGPGCVVDCIEGVTTLVAGRCIGCGIEVMTDCEVDLPDALLNPKLLRQVLLNLVNNAIEAMPNGGILTTGAKLNPENSAVRIWVTDTGCGMPKEVQERAFDMFFTTKGETGTGVGLAITKQIVTDVLRGRIWFESTPGVGTTFYVELPIWQPNMQSHSEPTGVAHGAETR